MERLRPFFRLTMKNNRSFGRVFRPDKRDRDYRIKRKKSKRMSRSWRTKGVLDQLDTNSCCGQSAKAMLAAAPVYNVGLDAFGLYELAKYRDEWRGENYEGTSVRGVMSVLMMLGLIEGYEWAPTIDDVVYTLLEVGPLGVGTAWLENMMWPDEFGKLDVSGDDVGGHAYLLKGVDLRKEELTLLNSWGEEWGRNGTGRIKIADFQSLLEMDGEACIAREVKVK